MSSNNKIGYIINETGFSVENFDIRTDKASNLRFYNPEKLAGYGVLQTAEEKNRNNRLYTRDDLFREINCPRTKELLGAGQLLSESSHPLTKDLARQQTIVQTNSCARFLKLWMEGNNVMGIFQGTNNDLGETFDKDLRLGVKPAFSLRALGTISSTPRGAVVENLKMITYDYVIYPSHPGAYTHGVLNESAGYSNEVASSFKLTNANNAETSFISEFTSLDVLDTIERQSQNESAINYIMDKSLNMRLLKEYFDINNFDTIDLISNRKIALTEAGNMTVVLDIDDYISKEIQDYIN